MNSLNSEERELLSDEQQKEYIELQKELLESCKLEPDLCDENMNWKKVTSTMSTLSVTQNVS